MRDQFNRPLHDLRISVLDRCNFRCPYCMPAEQFHHTYEFFKTNEWLSFEEIERLARIFVSLGVKKLRLTGGEPLLRPDIDQIIQRLSTLEGIDDLALTTNGALLALWAPKLKAVGLQRLTVSLDTLDREIFSHMSGGRGHLEEVLEGIQAAQAVGFKSIKINTVLQRGVNDHTILDLVQHFRGSGHTLRFIEYMDVGNQNGWDYQYVIPSQEIVGMINKRFPLERIGGTEGGETSERYRYKDGAGEIGFISSVTHAFCGTCNRLRLSADGKMYTCLFATHGIDLRAPLRAGAGDASLKDLIRTTWTQRQDHYSELRLQIRQQKYQEPKVEMYRIGG